MASVNYIDEPLKYYNQVKDVYHKNAEDFFDNLIKETNTNVEANKATCESYYKKLSDIELEKKNDRNVRRQRSFLKFLMVLCFILIVTIPVALLIKSHIKNKTDNAINELEKKIERMNKESEDLKAEAIRQTSLFNAKLDWNIPATLVNKTCPIIEMDKIFDNKRLGTLIDRHDFREHAVNNISTKFVQSGAINGNPFIIENNYVQEMREQTYSGSLVIHWQTYEKLPKGERMMQTHTQTLVAFVYKPCPEYFLDTWLVYGNEAAPKLKFSRHPTKNNKMDEKELRKFGEKVEKKLSKIAEKDASFTQLGNAQFEGLFNAINRDNEVEFRLLFTPLAQQNMIDLINTKEPFGDDFLFIKEGELNYIKSNHSQGFNYSSNPNLFINYDISKARELFTSYCDSYFKGVYFDLAPLLSIPLYQNLRSKEYIYKENNKSRFTSFEVESLVNAYDKSIFAPKGCVTDLILKSLFVSRNKDYDVMNITSYGFRKESRVSMVPTLGGDGHTHLVPVPWFEYIPVKKDTQIMVSSTDKSRYEFNNEGNIFTKLGGVNVYYQKGLISSLFNKKE